MKYLFLLLLPVLLFGSKILSYNVYERSQHVDIMLTFDTPYEGKLSQIKKNGNIILKLHFFQETLSISESLKSMILNVVDL